MKQKKKIKLITWGYYHIFECHTCYEMERRGYISESRYWNDFFKNREKPVKYKLIKSPDRKPFFEAMKGVLS